jgi:hypothetical protein
MSETPPALNGIDEPLMRTSPTFQPDGQAHHRRVA